MGEQSKSPCIQIQLLGDLKLTANEICLDSTFSRTHQLRNLLGYLIAFRHKVISQDALIEVLWPDGNSENPVNALKNLIYRLRAALDAQQFPQARELIVNVQGSYRWNNSIPCEVDAEHMEQLKLEADNPALPPTQRAQRYLDAISLYTGDYLAPLRYESWVVSLSTYYRTIFFQCVREAGALLIGLERFDEVEQLCKRASQVDPFEEQAHKMLIYALVRQNRHQAALRHYRYVDDLFYRELGVRPSASLRKLYQMITKVINNTETDLSVIKEGLSESQAEGAFYCDYEVFKNLYRLEARVAERSGQSVFLGLLTLMDESGATPENQVLAQEMDVLLATARRSLRKGDVISRFSPSQYVLMLPTLTYENGQMVLQRIVDRYEAERKAMPIRLIYTLEPLDPAM